MAARCDEALLDFDDAFRQARLATVYAIGEDGAARALDTRASRDVVQTYTLLFQITNCVVVLRALSLPPPPKRRTATAVLTSALRRNAAAARAALRATVLGDGRRKHAPRGRDLSLIHI